MQRSPMLARTAFAFFSLVCLACNTVSAAPQDTARALIERAAYAEEHERNFDAAAELYAKAAKAATDAGDAATATEATAARDRVLARQGKAAPAQASPADEQIVMRRALATVAGFSQGVSDNNAAAERIAIFGNRVVPWLERILVASDTFKIDDVVTPYSVTLYPNANLAAVSLVRIATPESNAALERGLASPDPTVRMAIVSSLSRWQHADIARRMALDPVPAVSSAAIELLADSEDPRLADVMEAAARNGSWKAMQWLGQIVPARVVAIALDRGATLASRRAALQRLDSGARVPPSLDTARVLLAVGIDGDDPALRDLALPAFKTQVWNWAQAGQNDALREDISKLIAARLERELSPVLIRALPVSGSASTIKALTALIPRIVAKPEPELVKALNVAVQWANGEPSQERFDAWIAMYRALPSNYPQESNDANERILARVATQLGNAANAVSPELIARGARGLEGEAKTLYVKVLVARLESELRKEREKRSGWPVPGSIDKAMLPLALEVLAATDNRELNDVMVALVGIGDVAQVGVILDYVSSRAQDTSSSCAGPFQELAKVDPKAAAAAFNARIEPALASATPTTGQYAILRMLRCLPDQEALEVFRAAWPKAVASQVKVNLFAVLIDSVSGPAATGLVLEHYPEMTVNNSSSVRADAIKRFGHELYEPAIGLLGQALKDADEKVRIAAREASQAFKTQREALEEFAAWTTASKEARDSIADLSKLLESNNRDVVIGAIKALGAVKARTALPALVKLLERNDPEIKTAVQDAIAKIGG